MKGVSFGKLDQNIDPMLHCINYSQLHWQTNVKMKNVDIKANFDSCNKTNLVDVCLKNYNVY